MTQNSSYINKLKTWLNTSNGKTPTYDALVDNLVNKLKSSDSRIDGGHHTIEFPVPAVFYDHELDTYRPDYEYETFMFNRLLGVMNDNGLLKVSNETQILGTGQDKTDWRPYIVTKVEFESVDSKTLLETIKKYKQSLCDGIIGNLVVKVIDAEDAG